MVAKAPFLGFLAVRENFDIKYIVRRSTRTHKKCGGLRKRVECATEAFLLQSVRSLTVELSSQVVCM